MKICFISIDVEHDVGTGGNKTFNGVEKIDGILNMYERFNASSTFFVTGDVLSHYTEKVKEWSKKYEVASHSYSHIYFNELSDAGKEEDIRKFIDLYKEIFSRNPKGFRAPSHVIDDFTMRVLEKYGFVYDSSIVPHYPPLKKYRGYPPPSEATKGRSKGRAPLTPFRKGNMIELPVTGQLLGIPLAGAWIRGLPVSFYTVLFALHKPDYITLSMHSWDVLDERFIAKLEKILRILKSNGYVFKSGEQVAMEQFTGQGSF